MCDWEGKAFDEEKAIYLATYAGDARTVEDLLKRDVSPNIQNHLGESLLHVSCQINESVKVDIADRLSILKLLWESGARINARGGQRRHTALHVAVKSQLVEVVNFLLLNGASVSARDKEDQTALHIVANSSTSITNHIGNNNAILSMLLQHGANFHAQDKLWRTPLIEAVCSRNREVVPLLLKAGAQIDYRNRLGLSALYYACEYQSEEMVKLLLERGASVNIYDLQKRSTPLHFVAGSGRRFTFGASHRHENRSHLIAELLINAGAQVNAIDNGGSTALHIAADTKDEKLADMLLEAGASVDVKDEYGNTPLHVLLLSAQSRSCSDEPRLERITKLIVDRGANVNEQNNNLETPFLYSVWHGNPSIVSILIQKGADTRTLWHTHRGSLRFLHNNKACNTPEICGHDMKEGFTPLNAAVTLGHLELVTALIDKNNNIEAGNYTDHNILKTPLYFAVENGHYHIAKLLLDSGCQVNRFVLHDTTVLHIAVSKGYALLTHLLIAYGADFQVKDGHGRTPLDCALEYDKTGTTAAILVCYLAKRHFRNSSVNKHDLETINSRSCEWLRAGWMDCLKNLHTMKHQMLCSNFSKIMILSKSIYSLCVCLKNQDIVNSFNSVDFYKGPNMYEDILRIRMDLALERRDSLDLATESLSVLVQSVTKTLGYETLPHIIISKILYYCELRTLQKLTLALFDVES